MEKEREEVKVGYRVLYHPDYSSGDLISNRIEEIAPSGIYFRVETEWSPVSLIVEILDREEAG